MTDGDASVGASMGADATGGPFGDSMGGWTKSPDAFSEGGASVPLGEAPLDQANASMGPSQGWPAGRDSADLASPDRRGSLMPMVAEMPPPAPHAFPAGVAEPLGQPPHQFAAPPAGQGAWAAATPPMNPGAAAGGGPGGGFGNGMGGGTPYWRGERLVDPRVSDSDRAIAVIMHLWWIGFLFTGLFPLALLPLILWAVRQSASGFVDDHGREILNTQLTILLFAVSIIGLPVAVVLIVVSMVNSIRGAIAAAGREHFRYGMIFRPIG